MYLGTSLHGNNDDIPQAIGPGRADVAQWRPSHRTSRLDPRLPSPSVPSHPGWVQRGRYGDEGMGIKGWGRGRDGDEGMGKRKGWGWRDGEEGGMGIEENGSNRVWQSSTSVDHTGTPSSQGHYHTPSRPAQKA